MAPSNGRAPNPPPLRRLSLAEECGGLMVGRGDGYNTSTLVTVGLGTVGEAVTWGGLVVSGDVDAGVGAGVGETVGAPVAPQLHPEQSQPPLASDDEQVYPI